MASGIESAGLLIGGLSPQRCALVVVDVVESVRLMQQDEARFIAAWRMFVLRVRTRVLPQHNGTLVKSLGDGLMLKFPSPFEAVDAAFALRLLSAPDEAGLIAPGHAALPLRLAVHATDVVTDDLDLYGSGVNLVSRLVSLARPGEIIVSAEVRDVLADTVQASVTDLGECYLKHVDGPVRAWRIEPPRHDDRFGLPPPVAWASGDPLCATIAVMPFRALGGDDGCLGTALADAICARMARAPELRITARLSTNALEARSDLPAACSRYLGAAYVVSGEYTLVGRTARGQVLVEDSRFGTALWTDGFEIDVPGLFLDDDADFDRLAVGVAMSLMQNALQRARSLPLPNLESFALYLAGIGLLHRLGRRDFWRAREVLGELRDRHARLAAPVAMLARWHMLRILQGWAPDPRGEGKCGLALARQALDLEPDHAMALSMQAMLGVHFGDGLEAARDGALRAVELDPQEPTAWKTLAGIFSYMADGPRAIASAERAIQLSPLDPCRFIFDLILAAGQLVAGRADDAVQNVASSIRLNAMHPPSWRLAVIANMLAGRADAAKDAAAHLLALDPTFRVRDFAERYPGRDLQHAGDYIRALRAAGIPA